MSKESGSLLAFLPGVAAIKQVEERLSHLPVNVEVCPLYGQLSFAEQQKPSLPLLEVNAKLCSRLILLKLL